MVSRYNAHRIIGNTSEGEKEEEALLSRLTHRRKREKESLMVAGRPINQFWLRETIKRMIHLEKRGARSRLSHEKYPYFQLFPINYHDGPDLP